MLPVQPIPMSFTWRICLLNLPGGLFRSRVPFPAIFLIDIIRLINTYIYHRCPWTGILKTVGKVSRVRKIFLEKFKSYFHKIHQRAGLDILECLLYRRPKWLRAYSFPLVICDKKIFRYTQITISCFMYR